MDYFRNRLLNLQTELICACCVCILLTILHCISQDLEDSIIVKYCLILTNFRNRGMQDEKIPKKAPYNVKKNGRAEGLHRAADITSSPSSTGKKNIRESFKSRTDFVTTGLESSFASNEQITKQVNKMISARVKVSNNLMQQVNGAFEEFTLSKFSEERRNDISYLKPPQSNGQVRHNIEKELKAKQKEIVKRCVKVIKDTKPEHEITLNIPDEKLSFFGLNIADNGRITGQVNTKRLAKHIEEKLGQTSEIVNSMNFNKCDPVKNADQLLDKALNPPQTPNTSVESNGQPEGNGENNESGDATILQQFIRDRVDLQTKTMTSPETQLAYNIPSRLSQEGLTTEVQTFELKGGPVDVTAFHDFYSLNIAFENVWTEIFDGKIEGLGRELYEEYLKAKEQGVKVDILSVSTV